MSSFGREGKHLFKFKKIIYFFLSLTCLYSYIFPTRVNLLDFGSRNVIKRTTTEASKPSPEKGNDSIMTSGKIK